MNRTAKTNPFTEPFDTSKFDGLVTLSEPPHLVLADFIRNCSDDPATRTMTIAAWVLANWQMAGRYMGEVCPSVMLVNTADEKDEIYTFLERLITDGDKAPKVYKTEGYYRMGSIEGAPSYMLQAYNQRRAITGQTELHELEILQQGMVYHDAKRTGFGSGISRRYRDAWHPKLGLLADRNAEIILRVSDEEDVTAFRDNIARKRPKLYQPKALNSRLDTVDAHASVFGSIQASSLDRRLIARSVSMGIPMFFLPHANTAHPKVANPAAWTHFSDLWLTLGRTMIRPAKPRTEFTTIEWVQRYIEQLRPRLARLPSNYEFAVLQVVHRLGDACEKLIQHAAHQNPNGNQLGALVMELYQHTLRGIVIGVASFDWFLTTAASGDSEDANDADLVLHWLRKRKSATLTKISKNLHLLKKDRDQAILKLVAAGLAVAEGDTIRACSYAEFVQGLHTSKALPPVVDFLAGVIGPEKA